MRTFLAILIYSVPVVFILLSIMNMRKYRSLQGSGRIPDIVGARARQELFFALSILSAVGIFILS